MTKINILLDKYMPLRKINKKEFRRRYKPWISDEILSKIDSKNRLFKKYVKCKNSERKIELNNNYKTQKNEITNLTRQSKKAYYDKYFTENKNNLKKIWQGIKNIINIKSKNQDHPTCLISEEKTISDPTEMAGKFNDFFTSVADNILKKRKYAGNKSFHDYLKNPVEKTFALYPCDDNESKSRLTSLNASKASGPNSIPTNILQLLKNDICSPLSIIFNLSFSTGQHPDMFKISKTIPVFKKGSRMIVSNYRPISLLSNLNKILEKIIFSRIYKFLEEYRCIYNLQFGFRSKHSTNHALIDITESIRRVLDENGFACGVFVDLQKAFDTVNHSILKSKLYHYGIRGVANDWFSSYLSNRSQFVSILGFESESKTIKHGVPQGSVLGPLLFLIYINDLHVSIKHSKVYHFADDTNLLNINNSPKKMQKQINSDLKSLCKWLLANKISLNCSKTEIIFFKKSANNNNNFKFNIKLNGCKLTPSNYIKYLGIYLDPTLSGKHHRDILITKLNRANGMLCKARHYISKHELKSLYYAIFSSHMSYGCQIWGQTTMEKIFNLQKKAIRIISFTDFDSHSSPRS